MLGGNPVDGGTINIYSQVGLVTLVGVISKHGILIVEFANTLMRDKGLSRRAAVEEAAAIRLRPVLMTTAALVLAMVPLLIASGPGATSRFSMGLVIAAGMSIGTLFTLFVLPAFYVLLGKEPAGGKAAAMPDDPRAATVM
jgi:multidrug efflux pump